MPCEIHFCRTHFFFSFSLVICAVRSIVRRGCHGGSTVPIQHGRLRSGYVASDYTVARNHPIARNHSVTNKAVLRKLILKQQTHSQERIAVSGDHSITRRYVVTSDNTVREERRIETQRGIAGNDTAVEQIPQPVAALIFRD